MCQAMKTTARQDSQSSDPASRRRDSLLQEARRKRIAWINSTDDDETELKVVTSRKDGKSGLKQSTVKELVKSSPGLESAQESVEGLVAHLNKVLGEERPDAIEYVLSCVPDKDMMNEDDPFPRHEVGMPPYEVLLRKLKHPAAAEVVKAMQRFVTQFVQRQKSVKPSDITAGTAAAASFHAFLQTIETEMRKHALWRDETPGEWEETREGVEKFILRKLHPHLFAPHEAEDLRRQDEGLHARLAALAFLGPAHLDIKSLVGVGQSLSQVLAPACAELLKLRLRMSTREMVDTIMGVTRVLTRTLIDSRSDGSLPGADEFLPALILLIKEANPRHLHSVLEVVQRYRHPSKLVSEAGYVFTHVVSAVHFLETADAGSLGASPEEYAEYLHQCQHGPTHPPSNDVASSPHPSPSHQIEEEKEPPLPPKPTFKPRSIQEVRKGREKARCQGNGGESADALEAELRATWVGSRGGHKEGVIGLRAFRQRARTILSNAEKEGAGGSSLRPQGGWESLRSVEKRLELRDLGPVREACTFLEAEARDLRDQSDAARLLEEYRELAALAQDLLSGQQMERGPRFSDTMSLTSSLSRSMVFTSSNALATPRSNV